MSSNFFDAKWFEFDASNTTASWTVDDSGGNFFYRGWMIATDGTATIIEYTYANGDSITVGTGIHVETIIVLPLQINWQVVSSINVTITSAKGSSYQMSFSSTDHDAKYITIASGSYSWTAEYALRNSSTQYLASGARDSSPLLLLPPAPPLVNLNVSIDSQNFTALSVEEITVNIKQPFTNELSHTFSSSSASPWEVQLFQPAGSNLQYQGSYTVQFNPSTGLSPYTATLDGSATNIVISEMGVRKVDISSAASSLFSITSSVYFQYGHSFSSHVALTQDHTVSYLKAGQDYSPGENLRYQVEYKLNNTTVGSYYISPYQDNQDVVIEVDNPFQMKKVTLAATGLSGQQNVQLTYNAYENGPIGTDTGSPWTLEGNQASTTLTGNSGSKSKGFSFYTVNPSSAMVQYSGTAVYDKLINISTTYDNSKKITFGPDQDFLFSVKFDPAALSFSEFTKVTVQATGPDGRPTEGSSTMTFIEGGQSQFWGYGYPPEGEIGTYDLVITYYVTGQRDNHVVHVNAQQQTVYTIPDYSPANPH